MNNVENFLNGGWPICSKNPQGIHVKVAGMHIRNPYCLHCRVLLTNPQKKGNN